MMQYPLDEQYPAVYRDAYGEEATVLHNDGRQLRMTVRGVTFAGTMLDDFEVVDGTDPDALSTFTWNSGPHFSDLCGCEIEYRMPVSLVTAMGETVQVPLDIHLVLGKPTQRGLSQDTLTIELQYAGQIYKSDGESGDFENALLQIQAMLPQNAFLKMCIRCAFSDYSPAGNGLFASLACFRDNKDEYLKVSDKEGIFRIWDTQTESVQETYLCPEFARRVPGTGYRG